MSLGEMSVDRIASCNDARVSQKMNLVKKNCANAKFVDKNTVSCYRCSQ
jgi:hypothetical protein